MAIEIVTRSSNLPSIDETDFFHSKELFLIIENTPLHKPYMLIVRNEQKEIVAHLLGVVVRKRMWLPPFMYSYGRVYGEGVYEKDCNRQQVFALMLEKITQIFRRTLCLYFEFSDLSTKMFGYKNFREHGYFHVNWQEIHNSFAEENPESMLSKKMKRKLELSRQRNVTTRTITDPEEITTLYELTKKYFRFRVRRQTPPKKQFIQFSQSTNTKLFASFINNKMVASAVCAYSNGNAYLWILASKRKSYYTSHPDAAIVWHIIKDAHDAGMNQVCFLDAGLPIRPNSYRDFILGFGGKPVTKYRWFNISVPWINRIAHWFFSS